MSNAYHDLPVGLCHVDQDLRIVEINGWLAAFSAVAASHCPGRTFGEIFPGTADTIQQSLRQAIQTGEPVRDRTIGSLASSPSKVQATFRYSCVPVREDNDTVAGASCSIEDVTKAMETAAPPEPALSEGQQQLDSFFVDSPAGLAIVDDQLRYVKINKPLADINGATVAQHIGRTARQIMPELAAVIEPMLRRVLDEGNEYLNIEVDGETPAQPGVARQWMVSYFPIKKRDGSITSVGIVVIETTERNQVENALRQSEEHMREAQRVAKIGSFEGDIFKNELWWSDELYDQFGLNPEHHTPTKESFDSLLHPDDRAEYMEALTTSLSSGRDLNREFRAKHKSGDWRYFETAANVKFDSEGRISGLRGTVQDISERKQTEEILRSSVIRSRTVLEESPVCNKVIDLDGHLLYMSNAGVTRLKIPNIEQFYGCPYPPEFYSEAMRRPLVENLNRAIAGQISRVECQVTDTEGETVWYDTTFVPALDDAGRVLYVVATSVDVTERRQAETLLRESEEKYRTLVEVSPYCIHQIDAEGRLASMNRAGLKMMAEQDECAIQGISDVTMPEMNGVELGQEIRQRHPGMKILYLSGYADHHISADDDTEHLIKGGTDQRTPAACQRTAGSGKAVRQRDCLERC
jgi:PAS domain S-box-containing protein